jgi:hypothetical protein
MAGVVVFTYFSFPDRLMAFVMPKRARPEAMKIF